MGASCFRPLKSRISPDGKSMHRLLLTSTLDDGGTLNTERNSEEKQIDKKFKELMKDNDSEERKSGQDQQGEESEEESEEKNSDKIKINLTKIRTREIQSPLRKTSTMDGAKEKRIPERRGFRNFTQVPHNTQLLMIPTSSLIRNNDSNFSASPNVTMGKIRRNEIANSPSFSARSGGPGGSLNFSINKDFSRSSQSIESYSFGPTAGELNYNSKLKHSKSLSRPSLDLLLPSDNPNPSLTSDKLSNPNLASNNNILNNQFGGNSNPLNNLTSFGVQSQSIVYSGLNNQNPNPFNYQANSSNVQTPQASSSSFGTGITSKNMWTNPVNSLVNKPQLDSNISSMTDSINMKESQLFANRQSPDLFIINEMTPCEDTNDEEVRKKEFGDTPMKMKKKNKVLPRNYRMDLLSRIKKTPEKILDEADSKLIDIESKLNESDSNNSNDRNFVGSFETKVFSSKEITDFYNEWDEIKEEDPLTQQKESQKDDEQNKQKDDNTPKYVSSGHTSIVSGEKKADSNSDSRETVLQRQKSNSKMITSSRMMKMSSSTSKFIEKSTTSFEIDDGFSKIDFDNYSLVTENEKIEYECLNIGNNSSDMSEFQRSPPQNIMNNHSPRRRSNFFRNALVGELNNNSIISVMGTEEIKDIETNSEDQTTFVKSQNNLNKQENNSNSSSSLPLQNPVVDTKWAQPGKKDLDKKEEVLKGLMSTSLEIIQEEVIKKKTQGNFKLNMDFEIECKPVSESTRLGTPNTNLTTPKSPGLHEPFSKVNYGPGNLNLSRYSSSGGLLFNKNKVSEENFKLKKNASLIESMTSSVKETKGYEKSVDKEGNKKINQYIIIKQLGKGSFGKVKLVLNREINTLYAFKICSKKILQKKLFNPKLNAFLMMEKEIAIMKKLNHPNIVNLVEVIEDDQKDKIYLVMEYMKKGAILSSTFWKHTLDGIKNPLTENKMTSSQGLSTSLPQDLVRKYFREFLLGLDYLHNYAHVVHRDIKPENLLINEADTLKISDFGVAHILDEESNDVISNNAGTKIYQAPESLEGKNFKGKPADIWSAGVTLYYIVYGKFPFYDTNLFKLSEIIKNDSPDFPRDCNPLLRDLIEIMLEKDPEKRPTVIDLMVHPWVTDYGKMPLGNLYEDDGLQISEADINGAFSKLKLRSTVFLQFKMKKSLRDTRMRMMKKSDISSTPKI